MDTSLKTDKKADEHTGKKNRAFLCKILSMGALITLLCVAVPGRDAIANLFTEGPGIITGDVYYLREFREYIAEMANQALISAAGIGDEKGYALKGEYAEKYQELAEVRFSTLVGQGQANDLQYFMRVDGVEEANADYLFPIFPPYDEQVLASNNVRLCFLWDGESDYVRFFDKKSTGTDGKLASDGYYPAQYKPNKSNSEGIYLLIVLKDHIYSPTVYRMVRKAEQYRAILILSIVSFAVWIIFGIRFLLIRKEVPQAEERLARFTGRIWMEAKLLATTAALYVMIFVIPRNPKNYKNGSLWIYFPLSCLLYLLYLDMKQNEGTMFGRSLTGRGIAWVRDFISGQSWYRRGKIIGILALPAIIFLFTAGGYLIHSTYKTYTTYVSRNQIDSKTLGWGIAAWAAGILLSYGFACQYRFLKDTNIVVSKLSKMREGNGNVPLCLPKGSLLFAAAQDVNELENGIENAVEQNDRSNKMRVELLTNVSHDLKTPLTSIINYADLLCEEELPETAAQYAAALQNKAYRLKNMVQDVFDLSKATSGNLPVEQTLLDLAKLIRQTLADMDERIRESSLSFKLKVNTEPLMIQADGEKLYRVFQNLIVNALQYSLDSSRVYIQLGAEEGCAVAKMKNISRTELDFDTSEIVERFVRADTSRSTEGSGLGLSIVESFTEACGGSFEIITDADMFTVCIRFPLAELPGEKQVPSGDSMAENPAAENPVAEFFATGNPPDPV